MALVSLARHHTTFLPAFLNLHDTFEINQKAKFMLANCISRIWNFVNIEIFSKSPKKYHHSMTIEFHYFFQTKSLEFTNLLFQVLNLYKDQVKGFAIDINRHKESPDNIIHFELLNAEKRKEIESIAENAVNRSLGLATTDSKKSTIIGTR